MKIIRVVHTSTQLWKISRSAMTWQKCVALALKALSHWRKAYNSSAMLNNISSSIVGIAGRTAVFLSYAYLTIEIYTM